MLRKVSALFRLEGIASRKQYLISGLALFSIKYALDLFAVSVVFHKIWLPWDYLNIHFRELDWADRRTVLFSCLMLALALPFIWAGVAITLRRLRSAKLPSTLVWLFFVPYLNLLFFLFLLIAPEKEAANVRPVMIARTQGIWPSIFVITVVCLGLFIFSTEMLQSYGWGLFIGIPFFVGFVPGLLNGRSFGFWRSFRFALLAHGILATCLLMFAFEGILCLAMAAPLTLTTSAFGVLIGRTLCPGAQCDLDTPTLCCMGALLLPLVAIEKQFQIIAPEFQVSSSVEIQAPPELVWREVVAFSEIPEPEEWIFRSGIAYPTRAKIDGSGVGATRHCIFSTGEFIEPIQKWQPPELLQFTVTTNPPPLKELSFYSINPPHLHNFFISHAGQFKLHPTTSGTRLEGTTWYSHNLYPSIYWRFWSDYIIHKIHLRVLNHIRDQVECKKTPSTGNQ